MTMENGNLQSRLQTAGLEYILDMIDQLAELASNIGERQLAGALCSTSAMRRECEPVRSERHGSDIEATA